MGNLPKIYAILQHRPHIINSKDITGQTALHWAVKRRDFQTVKLLLYFGADPSIEDHLKRKPIDVKPEEEF